MTEMPRGTIDRWTHDYWTQQRWTTFAPLALRAAAALIRSNGLAVGLYTHEDGRLDALAAIHEVAESAEAAGGVDPFTKMIGRVVRHPGLALEPLDLLWQHLSTTATAICCRENDRPWRSSARGMVVARGAARGRRRSRRGDVRASSLPA